jgi:hypothetical protein
VTSGRLTVEARELWAAIAACDGEDLRPVTVATVDYLHATRGRWRRRPDSEQCCGHRVVAHRLEPWAEADVWLCRCCCIRCGHLWTEVGFIQPAHVELAPGVFGQLALLGLHYA